MQSRKSILIMALPLVLMACGEAKQSEDADSPIDKGPPAAVVAAQQIAPAKDADTGMPVHAESPPADAPGLTPLAPELVRAEWEKAENRKHCAPLVFTSDGGAPAKARRANFSGGWAVAFDTPGQRSAYGIAGPGAIDMDELDTLEQEQRLHKQWPYFDRLINVPSPAFAGYGLVGAQPYPKASPDGRGQQSLAYIRIGKQKCTYNVWSYLGRAHLEVLLDSLRML